MPSHRWCETLGHASHHHKPEHEKVPELRVTGQLTGGWLDPEASYLCVPALALLRPSVQRCSGCGGHRTQVGRPCCGVSWSSVGPDVYLLRLSSHCSSGLYRPSDATFLAQTSPNSMFILTFLSPLFGAAKLRATCLYPKSQARTSKATSACCHPPPFTSSSEISNNFHYWQSRCFLIACYSPTTEICRQEKYSCYTALTGLLCGFIGRRLAVECHKPPYHGLCAGTSIHFMHRVSQNFPGCGRESCGLLSELCKKLFFFLSKKSQALQSPIDSGRAVGWVFHKKKKEWIDTDYVKESSPKD